MKIYEAVVKRIEQLMIENDTNPNKLSKAAGVPTSTLTSILYGKSHNPGVATLQLLCDVFDITLSQFFNSSYFQNLDVID